MRRPVNGTPRITTHFGEHVGTLAKFGKHSGQDFGVAIGTPVFAPVAGVVKFASHDRVGGNMLIIFDGQFHHRLLHNRALAVTVGQYVSEGQHVADSGNTGLSTGAHLHWDICRPYAATRFSDYVNPDEWVRGAFAPAPPKAATSQYYRFKEGTRRFRTTKQVTEWVDLNFNRIEDRRAVITLPHDQAFEAVGYAQHPTGGAYLMNAHDFGNADSTGKPVNNNGILNTDLTEVQPEPSITYEAFPTVRRFHTNKECSKRAYGLNKTLEESRLAANSKMEPNIDLSISGKATTPSGAVYYMDSTGMGDFARSGRVAYNVGYSETDIDEGPAHKPVPSPEPQSEPEPTPPPAPEPPKTPENWQATYRAYDMGVRKYSAVSLPKKDVTYLIVDRSIHQYPTQKLTFAMTVKGIGELTIEGKKWVRAEPTPQYPGSCYAVPEDYLMVESDLYATKTESAPKPTSKPKAWDFPTITLAKIDAFWDMLTAMWRKDKTKK